MNTAKLVNVCMSIITNSSAIAETALQSALVMAKSGKLELADNIYRYYESIFNHCDVFGQQALEFGKKTQKGYYAVQGHSRSSRWVLIESPYATSDFLLVVNSN